MDLLMWPGAFLPLPDLACGGCRFDLRLDGLFDVESFCRSGLEGSITVLLEAGVSLQTRHFMCRLGQEFAALGLHLNCRSFGMCIKRSVRTSSSVYIRPNHIHDWAELWKENQGFKGILLGTSSETYIPQPCPNFLDLSSDPLPLIHNLHPAEPSTRGKPPRTNGS
ncbi:hypothetical protein Nepgr_012445 [Nepenthes gracilis]|uniref:Uncharacterized protein n=1 Tax=Nepenthes gracilis TaxID=150966 RepID=A0AAD3XN52_NEPGR|nr:hypothetical protein Nepgr_012445 [Nepenthes gracilis]